MSLSVRRATLLGMLGLPLWVSACAGRRPIAGPPGGDRTAAAADWARAELVTVALDEYAFRPGRITLREGQPYRLRLENRGARTHDFTAPGFFRTVAMREGDPRTEEVRAKGGSVDVPAGEAREVALVPLRGGSYPLECAKPLHDVFGMIGDIVVSP